MATLNKPAVRGFRTFAQISVVEAFLKLIEVFNILILSPEQHLAIIAFVTPFVTYAQNKLEQQTESGEYAGGDQVIGS